MSFGRRMYGILGSAPRRFAGMPPWVLVPQLFLAFGWLRAATAHAVSGQWWSGQEVQAFLSNQGQDALPLYDQFLARVVDPQAALIATVVVVAQLLVGLSLLLDRWTPGGLSLGLFMNLGFMAAGAVNPSIFYAVLTLVAISDRPGVISALSNSRRLARSGTILALFAVCGLAPAVNSLAPKHVIDDPALVLIFLVLLITTVSWATNWRVSPGSARSSRPIAATPAAEPLLTDLPILELEDLQRGFELVDNGDSPRRERSDQIEPGPTSEDLSSLVPSTEVVLEVERRTGYKFNSKLHARVARTMGARPPSSEPDGTIDRGFASFVPEVDRYLYTPEWIDLVCSVLSDAERFRDLTDVEPRSNERALLVPTGRA